MPSYCQLHAGARHATIARKPCLCWAPRRPALSVRQRNLGRPTRRLLALRRREPEEERDRRKVVMTARNAELLGYIRAFEAVHPRDPMSMAIVYGARHMRAVTSLLISELRYRVVEAEWATVFTF